ncbi:MAG: WD40 repeat-like protein [Phylliscum demangeonii]|nr:MAG: WD40 repeat-like protein [Phylliscum demangeonii]
MRYGLRRQQLPGDSQPSSQPTPEANGSPTRWAVPVEWSTEYTAHTVSTTVARFAPSGFRVASGDVSGLVRVWDSQGEGATKGEYHVISGRINDIAWDGDSQRIIAVGAGKERYGHCFTADSGNTVGEISGHSGPVNSVTIRQHRPLRAATGSDDGTVVFYHGAPFKFNTSLREQHQNFVHGVAFSPDGASLVSVGADKKIWLYDGKTGEARGQVGPGEHKGSIFAVSWAADSRRFVTASADHTVKVWDAEAGKVLQSWTIQGDASSMPHQQVGVVWPAGRTDGLILSLDLSGDLTYVVEGAQRPTQVIRGHQRSITAITLTQAVGRGDTLWTGSYDGQIRCWDVDTGRAESVQGEGHHNQIAGFIDSARTDGKIHTVAWDDTLRTIDIASRRFVAPLTHLSGQPKAIARIDESTVALLTPTGVQVYKNGTEMIQELSMKAAPLAIASGAKGAGVHLVAVAGEDHTVRVYSSRNEGLGLKLEGEVKDSTALITALAFSPHGEYLAVGNRQGKILVYDTSKYEVVIDRWSAHTARVTSISWNHEGTHAASGSLDTHLFVWSVSSPGKRIKMANAHKDGVNGVVWAADGKKIITVGADAAVKTWNVASL